MKKSQALLLTLVAGLALGATQVSAATATTPADVTFGDDLDGALLKPNEDPENNGPAPIIEITPGIDGNKGPSGLLRLQWAPAFHFARTEGKVEEVISNVKALRYNEKGDATDKYVEPFAQVSDYRESTAVKAGFNLKVQMTKGFIPTGSTAAVTEMKIALNGSQLTNNTDKAYVADLNAFAPTKQLFVKNDGTPGDEVTVLSSAKTLSGSQSSVVFSKTYQMNPATAIKDTDTFDAVQLVKPSGISVMSDTAYTAELTWTLTDGI